MKQPYAGVKYQIAVAAAQDAVLGVSLKGAEP